jgi:hypothetical protein
MEEILDDESYSFLYKLTSKKIKQMMEYNRFKTKRFNDGIYYTNLILKRVEVILEPSYFD